MLLSIQMGFGNGGVFDPYYGGSIINYKHKIYEGTKGLKDIDFSVTYTFLGYTIIGREIHCHV